MNLLLKSARIIDSTSPFHNQTKDILITRGVITKISDTIEDQDGFEKIELENLHVSPGWFDSSVCFGEPGLEERETIDNGLKTASKSGFTAVAVNPNTDPVADTKAAIEFMMKKTGKYGTELYPIGAFSKKSLGLDVAELYDMQQSGAIAFGDYNKPVSNGNLLKIGLLYAQNFDALLISFPQDNAVAGPGLVNEEVNSTKLGLKGIPALAEELQIARDIYLLEYTGGKLHIPTISTAKSVELIRQAKKKGLDMSCSVSAHHLVLTDDELFDFDANTKVLPPLRTKKDIKALLKGLIDGTIDMITSDHNPMDVEHKKVEYENAKFGTIGLESLFGALNGVIELSTLVDCIAHNPRNRFGLEAIQVEVGQTANLTLFNPKNSYTFTKDHILSTSKNAVFLNKKLNGSVYGILANNKSSIK